MHTLNSTKLYESITTSIPDALLSKANFFSGEFICFSTTGDPEDTSGWLAISPSGHQAVFGDMRSGKIVEWQSLMAEPEPRGDWWWGLSTNEDRRINALTEELDSLPLASEDHPVLSKHQVLPHGVREQEVGFISNRRNCLIVPVKDTDGRVHGHQIIEPDGSKIFRYYTKVEGHFFPIGLDQEQTPSSIILCDEFETSAKLYEVNGLPVVCAFGLWNFESVMQLLKVKYPKAHLITFSNDPDASFLTRSLHVEGK